MPGLRANALPAHANVTLGERLSHGLLGQRNYVAAQTCQMLRFSKPVYAHGWGVVPLAGTGAPVSFHDGTTGTFFCHTILFPSQKIAFVVFSNDDEPARLATSCAASKTSIYKGYYTEKDHPSGRPFSV